MGSMGINKVTGGKQMSVNKLNAASIVCDFAGGIGGETASLAFALHEKVMGYFNVEVVLEERPHSLIMDKRFHAQRIIFQRNRKSLIEMWCYKTDNNNEYNLRLLLPLNNAAKYIFIVDDMTETVRWPTLSRQFFEGI
jgi:hypothetical protein